MATRDSLLESLRARLGEVADDVWDSVELKNYIDYGIKALYPYFFQYKVNTTIAGAGPLQLLPANAKNLYQVGVIRPGATRVRPIRQWAEGDGNANVPKLNINTQTLVWGWTIGWDAPTNDDTDIGIPLQAEEVVVVRAQITALEKILTNRSKAERYFALQVRQGVTEQDLIDAIDALHATLKEHLDRGMTLPVVVR